MPESSSPASYKSAGVDIDAGNRLVDIIKPLIESTRRPEVLGGLGGFGGLFRLPTGYREPVLVSGTDGIGTKLKLGLDCGRLEGLGVDLVAMCVNDVLVAGAEPLFFLDYYATSKLEPDSAARLIAGIADGCRQAGCALIGGETAEMPGLYAPGDFDAAGFCVGIAEADALIDGSRTQPGDTVIGLASSGLHSNGFSLARKVLADSGASLDQDLDGKPLAEALLEPTIIYVRAVLDLIRDHQINALAHITGGGLAENLARVLPGAVTADLSKSSWPEPPVFGWLREAGGIADSEMRRTFNCGIGMVVVAPESEATAIIEQLASAGQAAWTIGRIESREADQPAVRIS